MIPEVGLIHMNGRVYDPILSRFVSADPHIQAEKNSQSYNRYTYVINNPLSYSDPSGFFFSSVFCEFGRFGSRIGRELKRGVKRYGLQITAIAVAIIIPYSGIFTSQLLAGFAAGFIGSRGNLKVALVGGVTGLVLGGTSIADWSLGVGKVAVSGFVGGVGSEIMGGDFRSGFVGGAIGSLASAVGSSKILTKTFGDSIFANTAANAVIGGTASALSGGKFANGAVGAAFSVALSGAAQDIYDNNTCFSNVGDYCIQTIADWKKWSKSDLLVAFQPPSLPPGVVNFSAGLGDALLLGFGDDLRGYTGVDGGINFNSSAYNNGGYAAFVFGGARLVYAGLAKAGSILASSGIAASQFRSSLKTAFRGGLGKNWRKPDLLGVSDSILRLKAGKTNAVINNYGGAVSTIGFCSSNSDYRC